jgi:hypothetical protein
MEGFGFLYQCTQGYRQLHLHGKQAPLWQHKTKARAQITPSAMAFAKSDRQALGVICSVRTPKWIELCDQMRTLPKERHKHGYLGVIMELTVHNLICPGAPQRTRSPISNPTCIGNSSSLFFPLL